MTLYTSISVRPENLSPTTPTVVWENSKSNLKVESRFLRVIISLTADTEVLLALSEYREYSEGLVQS